MKSILVIALLFVGNFATAAINIDCLVTIDNSESGSSSYITEMSLKEGHKTGVANVDVIYGNKVIVSISSGADGKPFVGGICAVQSSVEICGQERSGLVLSQSGGDSSQAREKTTIACTAD